MSDHILHPAPFRGFYPERVAAPESRVEGLLRGAYGFLGRCLWFRAWRLAPVVGRVRAAGEGLDRGDEAELRRRTDEVRRRSRAGGLTPELAFEAFALAREFAHRRLGMRPYDVQVMGAWALLKGMVAEMETGEGKTLTASLAASAAALAGIPVNVITVNDYLAQRDAKWMSPIYEAMGLTVGYVGHGLDQKRRQAAYGSDILYCSNKEIVFDYLKDRLAMEGRPGFIQAKLSRLAGKGSFLDEVRLRGLPFAIVDEADSVLIDEARTPLIISGQSDDSIEKQTYREALQIAQTLREGADYKLEPEKRNLELTEEGKERLEAAAGDYGGVWAGRRRREDLVCQALTASNLYHRDRDYIVRDNRVQIVDEYTGRVMADRSWERGLHQLIEAKEGCAITSRTETLARISYQRFFRRYLRLAGMTGTAREVAAELWNVYHLPVVTVPTNRRTVRKRLPSRICATSEARWEAVVQRIEECHRQGRPVLAGTRSVAASEHLSAILGQRGIPHRVLNARQDAEEAEIIAQAGQGGQVTVATNMAGRGTDIKLGPGVAQLGGLHVIATEYHDARRIDRQLFGRCGRQGDPGSCEAIVSLKDALFAAFLKKPLGRWLAALTDPRRPLGRLAGGVLVSLVQRAVQKRYFYVRRELLKFDESMEAAMAFSGRGE